MIVSRFCRTLLLCPLLAGGIACDDGGSPGQSGSGGTAAKTLSAGVRVPNEGEPLEAPDTDTSIDVSAESSGAAGSDAPAPVQPGDVVKVSLEFDAPEGNVVGAGVRFGEDGPIRTVDIPAASGLMNGVLDFEVEIPESICDDLANICHDIKCYEFAVTDAGEVSRANIMDIGLVCGGCDESSCRDLLMCEDEPIDAGTDTAVEVPSATLLEPRLLTFNGYSTAPGTGFANPVTCAGGAWYHVTIYADDGYSEFRIEGPPEPGESRSAGTDADMIAAEDCAGETTTEVTFRECEDNGSVGGTCTNTWNSVSGTISAELVEGEVANRYDGTDVGPFHEYTLDVTMTDGSETKTISGSFLVQVSAIDRARP